MLGVKSISTQQTGQAIDATHYLQIGNAPILVFDIEGESNTTTGNNYYIQLLATGTPASGITKPLYSRLAVPQSAATGINGFSFVYRPIGLATATMNNQDGATPPGWPNQSAVFVAISSTDNVYTSVAATTQVTVDIEQTYVENVGETTAGATAGTDSITVWNDNSTLHKLTQIQVSNTGASPGSPVYLMLFAYGGPPAQGSLPIQQWKITDTGIHTFRFNSANPVYQVGESANGTAPVDYALHTGCFLIGSSTTQYLTATVGAAWTIQAWYV